MGVEVGMGVDVSVGGIGVGVSVRGMGVGVSVSGIGVIVASTGLGVGVASTVVGPGAQAVRSKIIPSITSKSHSLFLLIAKSPFDKQANFG